MKGAAEKTVPSLLYRQVNIARSENFEFKPRGKLLPKARLMAKKFHFEQKSRLRVFYMEERAPVLRSTFKTSSKPYSHQSQKRVDASVLARQHLKLYFALCERRRRE